MITLLISAAFAQSVPAHVETARDWMAAIDPVNNAYASPSDVWVDATGELHISAVCGGFTAELFKETYAAVTSGVLKGLTGSGSPNAAQWYAAIDANKTYTNASGTFAFTERATLAAVAVGDVLASAYTDAGGTGHVMTVGAIALDAEDVAAAIPGLATVDRYRVTVFDASSDIHGATDSRALAEEVAPNAWIDDEGGGEGEIFLFAHPTSGAIVGWTWSLTSPSPYQGTDPAAAGYRPLVAGALSGPGM